MDLTWTGSSSSYSVQRRVLGGSYQTIATASTAQYADTTIDAYTDYQYQVLAGSAASNAVSVGPPPAGFNNVAPAPIIGGNAITGYGDDASLALDANGDPAFAFLFDDPNQDGDTGDTQLLFRSWNRAQFTWNPDRHGVRSRRHCDCTTGTRSRWRTIPAPARTSSRLSSSAAIFTASRFSFPRILGRRGPPSSTYLPPAAPHYYATFGRTLERRIFYFAVIVDTIGAERFYSGSLSAAGSTWVLKSPTKPANTDIALFGTGASLALDSTGTPAVTYWVSDTRSSQSYNDVLLYWRPLSGATPVVVTDTQNQQSDTVAVKMRFAGNNPRILFYAQRNDADFGVGVHLVRSDDGGTTWQTPVVIPPDMGTLRASYPSDLALDSQGHGAVAMGQNGSSGDGSDCAANPKLSRSSNDLLHWTTSARRRISV